MPKQAIVDWTQFLPVQDRTGTFTSNHVSIPTGVSAVSVRVDCTPFASMANPFNDPSVFIKATYELSLDGGITWPVLNSDLISGSASGLWGRNPYPTFRGDAWWDGQRATHVRAGYSIVDANGNPSAATVTFGASIKLV